MIREPGVHLNLPHGKIHLFELLDLHRGGHFAQVDWKELTLHLARKDSLQAVARPFIAQNPNPVFGMINR